MSDNGLHNLGVLRVQPQPKATPTQRYSHRNGEREKPTEAGVYGYVGTFRDSDDGTYHLSRGTFVNIGDWDGRAHQEGYCAMLFGQYDCYPLDSFVGQWWGPIVPPWEVQP